MKTKLEVILVVVLMLGFQSGCGLLLVGAGAAAGAGAVAYVEGELKTSEAAKLDTAWDAALAGVARMEFTVTEKTKDGTGGKILARGAQDRRIEVNLRRLTDETTEIRIRVGVMGDESVSRQLLTNIRDALVRDASPRKRT